MKITTQRLVIRPLAVKDRQAMQQILTDFENSDCYKYDYKAPTDPDLISNLIPYWVRNRHYYTIIVNETGKTAGFISLIKNELGFSMKTEFKHQGYGYEASAALLDYMIKRRGKKEFIAQAALENTPSVKLLEKLGFVLESTEYVQFRRNMPPVECGNYRLTVK